MRTLRILFNIPEQSAGPVIASIAEHVGTIESIGLCEPIPYNKNKPHTKKPVKGEHGGITLAVKSVFESDPEMNWSGSDIAKRTELNSKIVHPVLARLLKQKFIKKYGKGLYKLAQKGDK